MSKYRQTMSEALTQVHANEDASYLAPRLNPQQIANIKKVFMKKKASDITPSIKAMIKKMDIIILKSLLESKEILLLHQKFLICFLR